MFGLLVAFPGLRDSAFKITSPQNRYYNCIAWAAEDTNNLWWPTPGGYWPPGSPRAVTLEAFIETFKSLGYSECENGDYEDGYVKIAFFVKNDGTPTHAARQLPNGKWTSKCGRNVDIEHDLNALCGPYLAYGSVVCFMKKSA